MTTHLVKCATCRHEHTVEKVWQSASVTNPAMVMDPTTCQPGFDLPRCSWSLWPCHGTKKTVSQVLLQFVIELDSVWSREQFRLLNCFHTGQGPWKASLYKWGLTVTELLVWWWAAPDYEPHCGLLPANQVWRWTERFYMRLSTGWILLRLQHSWNKQGVAVMGCSSTGLLWSVTDDDRRHTASLIWPPYTICRRASNNKWLTRYSKQLLTERCLQYIRRPLRYELN